MKRKYCLFALALLGLTITSCGKTGTVGLDYDDADLDIDTPWVDYSVPVTKVNFEEGQDEITINTGEEPYAYAYTVEPAKAKKSSLIWTSSDEAVATVNQGVVTAVAPGTATITVSNAKNSFTPINLTVHVNTVLNDISFAESTVDADYESQYQLEVIYDPVDTNQKEVTWSTSNSELATVNDNGLVTTGARVKDGHGTVTISANSAFINKTISVTFNVSDHNIYATGCELDAYEPRVEIGHNFVMQAHATVNEGQVTDPTIRYYSTNSEILSVDEQTGVVHALAEGTAQVYAKTSNDIESVKADVTVFEVKVARINVDAIVLSNRNGRSDVQVPFTYDTDTPGYDTASIPNFTYEIDLPSVATVTSTGKLFAVADEGDCVLKITDTRSGQYANTAVHVGYEVDTVAISGPSTINVGQTSQLSVTTVPSGVPASYVTYVSSNPDAATVSQTGLVTAVAEGTTRITATVLGETATIDINVELADIPFAYDTAYVVGSANYYSGTSKPSSTGGSWDKANQARPVSEVVQGPHDTLLYEKRAIVTFRAGDVWKLRNATTFYEPDGFPQGATYKLGEYKTSEGAFAGENPDMYVDSDRNVVVNRAGPYAIYLAQYTNEHDEGWYSVYVGRHELNISDMTPQVQINTSVIIEAHDWSEPLSYEITEGASLISVLRNDYKFTITAGSNTGTAKIVFTDSFKSVEVVVSVTEDAPLPKTFEDGKPYIVGNADYHTGTATGEGNYWGSDARKAYKATLSSETPPAGVYAQYEAEVTFTAGNQFKVIVGGDTLYWDATYQDTEGAFATTPAQMTHQDSGDKNIVVNVAGTYKLYIKCLENDGGWQVYVAEKSGGDPGPGPQPTYEHDYYVVGSINTWTVDEDYGMTQDQADENHYSLQHITLAVGDELKINNPTTGDWYTCASTYEGCHYSISAEEGHVGNLVVTDAGTYTVNLYLDGQNNNYVTLADESTPPTPVYEHDYYVRGSFNSWEVDEDYGMTMVTATHYKLEDITLAVGDELKVYKPSDDTYYSCESTYDGCHYTISSEQGHVGNLVVDSAGTYTINYYVNGENNNYVTLVKDNDTPVVDTQYYLKGDFNDWSESDAYLFTADPNNAEHFTIEGVEITAGQAMKGYGTDDTYYGVASTYTGCGYTVGTNNNCVVSETGTYTINLYLNGTGGNCLTLTKTSGGDVPPEPSSIVTLYFTCPNSWTNLHVYLFDSSTDTPKTAWPGDGMNYVGTNEFGQSIYSVTFDKDEYDSIIFNSGSYQTKDLLVSSFGTHNACYILEGQETSGSASVGYWDYTAA